MKIGDRVKVKDQDIYGKIIYDHGTEIVIAIASFILGAIIF